MTIEPGDCISLTTGGGGGWGKPAERDVARIAEDLREGWITPERARRDYDYVAPDGDD